MGAQVLKLLLLRLILLLEALGLADGLGTAAGEVAGGTIGLLELAGQLLDFPLLVGEGAGAVLALALEVTKTAQLALGAFQRLELIAAGLEGLGGGAAALCDLLQRAGGPIHCVEDDLQLEVSGHRCSLRCGGAGGSGVGAGSTFPWLDAAAGLFPPGHQLCQTHGVHLRRAPVEHHGEVRHGVVHTFGDG